MVDTQEGFSYTYPIKKRVPINYSECYEDQPELPRQLSINSEITPLAEEVIASVEGCLSLPGLRGFVKRHTHISVVALDENGKGVEFEAHDFHAIVIQHEVDHLSGLPYINHLVSSTHSGFEKEFDRYPISNSMGGV